jgi:fermentation-respiration switch protein FrsA (DUF1100 family)
MRVQVAVPVAPTRSGGGSGRRNRHLNATVEPALVAVAGASVAVWMAMDGSLAGRALRAGAVAALTAIAVRRLPAERRRRGAVLLAIGLPATALGAGIGPAHLAKEGVGAEAALGMIALLAGLGLLVAGIRHVTSGHRRLGRAGLVVVSVVASLVALDVLVPAIAAVNVPATAHGRTPADLGLPYEDVWFRTADGVRLHGWYVPSRNGAAVVVRHGSGSTSSNALDQAKVLSAHGFGVLVTDARGHGRSGGRAMDFGWFGDLDTRAAVDVLAARSDIRPGAIGALGLSMGGEEVLGAAAADPRIRAVVAEGVTGRTAADHAWFSDAYGVRGSIQEQIERLQSAFTDALTPAATPTPLATAVARGPDTLLIAAGTVADEGEVATRLAARRSDGVRTWVVPHATHTGGLDADPAGWEARVVGFLEGALLP